MYLLLAVLGLCCYASFSLVAANGDYAPVVLGGPLIVMTSLVAEYRLSGTRASVVVAHGLRCSAACGILIRDRARVSCIGRRILYHWATREALRFTFNWRIIALQCCVGFCHITPMCSTLCMHVHSLQACPTLCDPIDCSPPGPSVHGVLLEWVVMSCSRGSSRPRDRTQVSYVSCIGRRVLYH